MPLKKSQLIIEKKLGIPGDYQFKALRSRNFLQANWHYNKLQALHFLLRLNKETSILDLGIGSGNFEFEFARQVKEITGVDYNDEAIAFVERNLKKLKISNVHLVEADIRDIHQVLKSEKYDLILLIDVIEHIHLGESEKLIKQLKLLLNKNGRICVITPNYNSPWQIIEIILDKISKLPKLEGEQHLAKFYRGNLTKMFTNQSYRKEFVSTFNLFSYLSPFKFLSTLLLKKELQFLAHAGNLLVGVFRKV